MATTQALKCSGRIYVRIGFLVVFRACDVQDWKKDGSILASEKKFEPPPEKTDQQQPTCQLKICRLNNDKIYLPDDIRSSFGDDIIRRDEWAKLVTKFDAVFGSVLSRS
jgi:hypothetical protein